MEPAGFSSGFRGNRRHRSVHGGSGIAIREAGGPYLYARVAFGRFLAIQNGWLTWLTRIAAVSAVANLFIVYLTELYPGARAPLARAGVLTVLIGFLAVVNYRGVNGGKKLSNFFTVTKVALLAFFVLAGLTALALHPGIRVTPAASQPTSKDWCEAVLLLMYSYGGFEAGLIVTGETRDARKDIPFALFTAIGAATVLFIAVQYLVIHTIPNVAASSAPAVDSAQRFLSPFGVQIVAAGTLISAYGYLAPICCTRRALHLQWGSMEIFPPSSAKCTRAFEHRVSRL